MSGQAYSPAEGGILTGGPGAGDAQPDERLMLSRDVTAGEARLIFAGNWTLPRATKRSVTSGTLLTGWSASMSIDV